MFLIWGKVRVLCYVNQEEISYVPSSCWRYRSTNHAKQAVLLAVGNHIGTTALCVFATRVYVCVRVKYVSVWWQFLIVCACSCVSRVIHVNIPLRFSKAQWALDQPKLRAPKIEPWSHPFHRSGPPSSSTPTPHTVSITWTLRITLWHKTRVCPLCDWTRSIFFMLFMNAVRLHEIWEVQWCYCDKNCVCVVKVKAGACFQLLKRLSRSLSDFYWPISD